MKLTLIRYAPAVAAAFAAVLAAPAIASAQPDIHAAAGAVNPQFPEVSLCANANIQNVDHATVYGTNQNLRPSGKIAVKLTPGQCTLVAGYWWKVDAKFSVWLYKDLGDNRTANGRSVEVNLQNCRKDPGKNIRYCPIS